MIMLLLHVHARTLSQCNLKSVCVIIISVYFYL